MLKPAKDPAMTRLNDSLDALFTGDTGTVRTEPTRPGAVEYRTAEQRFTEKCAKCRGTGQWRPGYPCFKCGGKGQQSFKTSTEARAKAREQASTARANKVTAWAAANPAEAAWITAKESTFAFAASMRDALLKYGDLTDGQTEAVRKCIASDAARAEARATERAERIANAPVADTAGVDRLKEAFDKAIAYSQAKGRTLRQPRITLGGVTISPAKATSQNAGALYVKNGQTYLGKISGGRFMATRECDDATQAKVLSFVADPEAAAKAYGQETGTCCICNRTLTAEESMSRFMGPICAEKFGWA